MIIVTEAPFIIAPIHTIVGMRFRPKTPRGTKLVKMHEKMPEKVNNFFANQPSDPPGPTQPLRYFGLLMVNLGMPPLTPNRPYHRPFNYPEYVKDSDPYAHVRIFKAAIRVNGEIKDAKIINPFSFTFKDIMFDWCNNYIEDYLDYTFAELQLAFYKRYKKVQNDEQVYL
jgi:hypothetical protein